MAELSEAELDGLEQGARKLLPVTTVSMISNELLLSLIAEVRELRAERNRYNAQTKKFIESMEYAAKELVEACQKALGRVNDA